MTEPLYTTEILRLAASLKEPHELEREDGRAELRSPTCGSRISLAVQLAEERRPSYSEAHIHVKSGDGAHKNVVEAIVDALECYLSARG
jgi:shikimate kinase